MTPTRPRGASVVEALVATTLTAIALGGLATVAGLATSGLRLARDTSTAVALAGERLESLRAGPRTAGTDTVVAVHGTSFERSWEIAPGRGRPDRLSVRVAWGTRALALTTEAEP